jgi:CDP-diacylglycerol--glycerol-3-phosphate 3-phosphatidyltransferase
MIDHFPETMPIWRGYPACRLMNLPNRLTVARFFVTVAFVFSLSLGWRYGHTLALLLFVIGAVTDYADGYIARRDGLVTDFGKLMDPLVDKIMISGAFICLVPVIPSWAAVVIISREFLITGLRLLAASKGIVLPAESIGKHKTGWQIATIVFLLAVLAAREFPLEGGVIRKLGDAQNYFGSGFVAVALLLTLYSGFGYLWKNRHLLEEM